ncbi:MAG: hypothetical protein HQL49_01460 [Gammaproteobacteria bacterium]|nr:hypothetical protein [Gammaproteobacteria bacterium]
MPQAKAVGEGHTTGFHGNVSVTSLVNEWAQVAEILALTGMVRQLAEHAVVTQQQGDRLTLLLDANFGHLGQGRWLEKLEDALQQHYGQSLRLQLEIAAEKQQTPARQRQEKKLQRQQQAEAEVAADPLVMALLQQLDARIVVGSVTPPSDAG